MRALLRRLLVALRRGLPFVREPMSPRERWHSRTAAVDAWIRFDAATITPDETVRVRADASIAESSPPVGGAANASVPECARRAGPDGVASRLASLAAAPSPAPAEAVSPAAASHRRDVRRRPARPSTSERVQASSRLDRPDVRPPPPPSSPPPPHPLPDPSPDPTSDPRFGHPPGHAPSHAERRTCAAVPIPTTPGNGARPTPRQSASPPDSPAPPAARTPRWAPLPERSSRSAVSGLPAPMRGAGTATESFAPWSG